MNKLQKLAWATAIPLAAFMAFSASSHYRQREGARDAAQYAPEYEHRTGPQLVAIVFAKKRCAWSNMPETHAAIDTIIKQMKKRAEDRGQQFVAVGVGLDWRTEESAEYFSGVGRFDELNLGYNWANAYALRYFWGDMAGAPSTPSVAIIERQFSFQPNGTVGYGVSNEILLARKSGLQEMLTWIEIGMPLLKH